MTNIMIPILMCDALEVIADQDCVLIETHALPDLMINFSIYNLCHESLSVLETTLRQAILLSQTRAQF